MSSAVAVRPRRALARWFRVGGTPRYVVQRLLWGLLVIVLVALTVFFVTRVASDPARLMLPLDATQQQYVELKHQLGLDQSIPAQFVDYVRDVATFDFGESYWQRLPVGELIADRLPNTFILVVAAMSIAILVGVPLGIGAALRPGSLMDQSLATFALLGLSLPQFWLGAMLILLFAVQLGWFPTSGIGGVESIVLPATALALPSLGRMAQIARSSMIDELSTQHVLVARAKGLSGSYVVFRHALRNVLIPLLTLASWETAYALAGYGVVVETVFAWPGIGYLAIQAIQREDLVLVQGIVITAATIVVIINIVTDLLYKVVDPRIEL